MADNGAEMFPEVDEEGNIIGQLSRKDAHGGSMRLHPVVHLHVFNSQGHLYLQKRPSWKDIQPGRWDTACGGHIDLGEDINTALHREAKEELGLSNFTPKFIVRYIFESSRERELVHVHTTVYDEPIIPNTLELNGGRFWTFEEIASNIGKEIFTPNFESEYKTYIQKIQ